MTDLRKAAQAVVAALEKAPYLRHEAIDALRAALAQPEQQAEPSIVVGHSVDRGGWCVYESTGSGEYACLLGPFATKDEADAAAHPPAQPPQPEQQATTDQLIDLSEELQKLRALHIAGAVRALRSPGDAPTPFDAGYDLACEEIAHRLAHEEWELNDDGWGPVGAHPPAQPIEPGNLYWRLHSLSKVLESSGRIDEHEQKGAYATILDAMNHVRSKP